MNGARTLLSIALPFVALSSARPAHADDKAACLAAAADGQQQRDAHRLLAARDSFRACARAQCPAVVQSSCAEWTEDVERTMPTIVLAAKDGAGRDVSDVAVTEDGRTIAPALDGMAIAIDPGLHHLRFQKGALFVEQTFVVREGEKSQQILVAFPAPPAAIVPPSPPVAATVSTPSPSSRGITGLALAGGGIALGVVGAIFGAEALSKKSDSEPYCGVAGVANDCYGAGVGLRDSAASDATLSTVFFAAGAVVLAGGVILWATSPSTGASVAFDGRTLRVGGAF